MADAGGGRPLLNHELARLRREWIEAYRTWVKQSWQAGPKLTEMERAAYRRYREAAETYFERLQRTSPSPHDG